MMYTQAIACIRTEELESGMERLRHFGLHEKDKSVDYIKVLSDPNDGTTTILLREDTPPNKYYWLCGFFAAL